MNLDVKEEHGHSPYTSGLIQYGVPTTVVRTPLSRVNCAAYITRIKNNV